MIPRTFPPAPAWSPDGHRIKSEVDYGRGPEKTWVYGALRVRNGHEITMTASSRNRAFYQQFLEKIRWRPLGRRCRAPEVPRTSLPRWSGSEGPFLH